MEIGDSIGKAAENAMQDLAGTSKPTETTDVPDPADPNDDVEVHSSLSEGSNAMAAEGQKAPGLQAGAVPAPVSTSPLGGDADSDSTHKGRAHGDREQNSTANDAGLAGDATAPTETDQG